jgi:hypothetical protein
MKLYFHQTSGGAKYLCSNNVEGTNEGTFDSDYIVRIDGDIKKDAELSIRKPYDTTAYRIEQLEKEKAILLDSLTECYQAIEEVNRNTMEESGANAIDRFIEERAKDVLHYNFTSKELTA